MTAEARPLAQTIRPRALRLTGEVAALAAIYFAAGKIGLAFAGVHGSVSLVWPPSGIALAALLLYGLPLWPAIFAGAFLVNLTTAGGVGASLGIAAGNTLEAVVGAALVRRFAGGLNAFDRPHDVIRFTVLAGMASTTISATLGVASLTLGHLASSADFGRLWMNWWVGDLAGDLVVAPLIILWRMDTRVRWSRGRAIEAAVLALVTLAVSYVVFSPMQGFASDALGMKFLCLPLLLWPAFRYGARETATATALMALMAARVTGANVGASGSAMPLELLQLFICVASVTALAVAAVVSERGRVEASVRRAFGELGLLYERQSGDLSRAVVELAAEIRARQEAERYAEAIVETIQDPLVLLDAGLTVRAVNAGFCRMFQTEREAVVARRFLEIGDRRWDMPAIRALLDEIQRAPAAAERREITLALPGAGTRALVVGALRLAHDESHDPLVLVAMHDVTESRRAMQALQVSEERFRAVVETAVDGIITADSRGRVVSLNQAAERMFGYTAANEPDLSLAHLVRQDAKGAEHDGMPTFLAAARPADVHGPVELTGRRRDGSTFPLELAVATWRRGPDMFYTAIARDVTERKTAERRLREMSVRTLQIRDEEQRRIARELHDSTAQKLWAIALNLGVLGRVEEALGPRQRTAIADSAELAKECLREIRNISALLHPPLLDDIGMVPAIRSHVDSFVRRTGIRVSLTLDPELERMSPPVEATIFRIVQECLTNIQRHAASPTAAVRIQHEGDAIRVEVSDEGRGLPKNFESGESGMGIHAMRGRVRQLDGRFEVDSAAGRGTRVRALIPLQGQDDAVTPP